MSTPLHYLAWAERLIAEGLAHPIHTDDDAAFVDSRIAAASVAVDISDRLADEARRLLMQGITEEAVTALMEELRRTKCTCSPDGRETHQIGCPDNPEEDDA